MCLLVLSFRLLAVPIALAVVSIPSWAQFNASMCGDLSGVQWDYRTATQAQHNEVEIPHFPPIVENLIRGNRGYLGGDLAYTLRASPNHHRALASIMRWSERLKTTQLPNMPYPVECYFERGIRYKANDHVVRMLYAQFLIGQARPTDAVRQLEIVAGMAGDSGFTMYNIGLLYSDMKDYAPALVFAHKAIKLGFSRSELRRRLESAGRWAEPIAESPQSPVSVPMPGSAASASEPTKD